MTSTFFGPFPPALEKAIQNNYLQKRFEKPLLSNLKYRQIADQIDFPGQIGSSMTQTRLGLMVPNLNPLNPSTNTNLDNGMVPSDFSSEQYTLAVQQYAQTAQPLNLTTNQEIIADLAIQNSYRLGMVMTQVVERLARNALFNAYLSGNTFVTVTLGAPGVTIQVDDVRGFQTVVNANSDVVPVSPTNPLPITINNNVYDVVGFTVDVVNVSSSAVAGGISGTLTLSAPVLVADATAGKPVIGNFAPLIVRPNGKLSSYDLTSSDILTMNAIFDAVQTLKSNNVPDIDGSYHCYLNPQTMKQLYQDSEFQLLNRGRGTQDADYRNGTVVAEFLGVRFIETTETIVQNPLQGLLPVPVGVQRAIICGKGTLVEGNFNSAMDATVQMAENISEVIKNGGGRLYSDLNFNLVIRPPIDALRQIITQSASWIGGFTVPTDTTTNSDIIPTASNAYFKRSVVIETAKV